MLESLRKGIRSWAVKGLLLLLVASFALWGIGDIFRSGREVKVAEVGDYAIPARIFSNEFRQAFGRLQQSVGGQLTTEQARASGLDMRVLNRLVNDALLAQEADRLYLRVPDSVLQQTIADNPLFHDPEGRFDARLYRRLLEQNNLAPEDYEALVQREQVLTQLRETMIALPPAPQSWAGALFRHRAERRIAEYVVISGSQVVELKTPEEAEFNAFYEANPSLFTAPEYRSITYVMLTPEVLFEEIEPNDEELYEEYTARIDEFSVPERRRAEQLLVPDQALVETVRTMLRGGKGFGAIADELANQGVSHVALGTVTRLDLMPEVAPTVFTLSRGGVSDAVETALGWHFFWVRDIIPPVRRSFDEVRQQLRDEYAHELARDGLYQLANALQDELATGAALEEAARRLNLPLLEIDAVSRVGDTPGGAPASNLPQAEGFLELAFQSAPGMESDLMETADGNYYILRVDEVIPRAVRPLEQVRDQVIAAWKERESTQSAHRTAQRIVGRVRRGEDLGAIAEEMGLALQTSEPLARNAGEEAGMLHPVLDGLFELESHRLDAVSAPTEKGYVVARLKAIRPADPEAEPSMIARVADGLEENLAQDVFAYYQVALENRYPVKVNFDVIDSLF